MPSVHDWIKAYGRAWEDRDDDAVGELFFPGAIYRSHPFREPLRGRDAIRTYWRQATGSLTGISLTFGRPITDGAHTSVEWWAILRSDQETATLSGALILRFGPDGRCEELREYWHLDEDHAIPAPDGWGR